VPFAADHDELSEGAGVLREAGMQNWDRRSVHGPSLSRQATIQFWDTANPKHA
jgi:hypothetical protein